MSSTRPPAPAWRHRLYQAFRVVSALVLLSAAVVLTRWGAAPAAPTPDVGGLTLDAPSTDVLLTCPAAPANTLEAVNLGATTARTTVTPLGDSQVNLDGTALAVGAPTSTDTARGGVLTVPAAHRTGAGALGLVTTSTPDGDLRGLTAAACAPPSTVSWIVGGSGAVGSSAELRLTNPGTTTVTARIRLYGSTGERPLPARGQISLAAGKSGSVLLETAGADERLAVSLEATGGSLGVVMVTESLDGETPTGVEVLTPGPAPSTDQTVPGVVLTAPESQGEVADATTGAVSSQAPVLRVVNPGTGTATVSVSLVGADGQTPLPGAQEVRIDPGAVFDTSLAGSAPGPYGVRVTSDQPVGAAVRLVRSAGEYPAKSGALAGDVAWIQAGHDGAVTSGTLVVPQGEGLTSQLVVTNSATTDATVTLTSADGTWSQDVTVPASTTLVPDVPTTVAALTLSSPARGPSLSAAVVTTQEVGGDVPGTLIAALPAVPDSAVLAQRTLLMR